MSKLITRASVAGSTLAGSALKAALTGLVDALNSAGYQEGSRTTVSSTATLTTTQAGLVLVDATSASIVITLPSSGATTDDSVFLFRRIDSTANTVTIQRGGTDTLEGVTTALSLASGGGILGLQMPAGSTNWRVYSQTALAAGAFLVQTGLGNALISQTANAITSAGTAPTYTITTTLGAGTALAAGQRFRVKFHAVGTLGSNTLTRDGLAAKNLVAYDAGGNKVATTIAANQLADVEYDGTDMVVLDPLSGRQLQPINATVAANVLTILASPLSLDFRSTTLGSGVVTTVSGTPAQLVIPSTATLGTTSAVASRLAVLALNNAGTIELAVVNIAGNTDLTETGLISTTAIAAASNSATTVYSTTARTSVAYRVLGYIDSTQATAGTWATAPSAIQGAGGANVANGRQFVLGTAVATTSGTSITFTGIPSWVKRITVMLNNVSTTGTSAIQVQLGAGSVTTTGYNGAVTYEGASTSLGGNSTTGLLVDPNIAGAAATQRFGIMTICNFGSNTWVATTVLGRADAFSQVGGGSVTLGGTLDRVVLTTVGGTDTFDLGSVNILWE